MTVVKQKFELIPAFGGEPVELKMRNGYKTAGELLEEKRENIKATKSSKKGPKIIPENFEKTSSI